MKNERDPKGIECKKSYQPNLGLQIQALIMILNYHPKSSKRLEGRVK